MPLTRHPSPTTPNSLTPSPDDLLSTDTSRGRGLRVGPLADVIRIVRCCRCWSLVGRWRIYYSIYIYVYIYIYIRSVLYDVYNTQKVTKTDVAVSPRHSMFPHISDITLFLKYFKVPSADIKFQIQSEILLLGCGDRSPQGVGERIDQGVYKP